MFKVNWQSKQRGFTLAEVIVVIALNTMLVIVLTASITSIYKQNAYSFAQAAEIDAARKGLFLWVRDAREMTNAGDGSFPLREVSDNTLGFYSDIDRDDSVEYVEYVLDGTDLYKYTYNPIGSPPVYDLTDADETVILSEYVQNIDQGQKTFEYYDSNGVLLSSPQAMISDIRYITMQIIVNIDPLRSPGEFMLQGSAAPRNLKDNL